MPCLADTTDGPTAGASLRSVPPRIETLPSSNVRIGVYHDMSEHHLFRWLGLTGETLRNEPVVCVGSDDTGIFATSLRNEYVAVWNVLCRHMRSSTAEAERIITRLNDNGWNRRFEQRA